jgi:hypothetical protein
VGVYCRICGSVHTPGAKFDVVVMMAFDTVCSAFYIDKKAAPAVRLFTVGLRITS